MKLRLSFVFAALMAFGLKATVHSVVTSGNTFSPATLTITAGDTVVWTNTGGSHNVNGTVTTFPTNPASFGNSVGSGWTFTHIFAIPGTYSYQCDPHAGVGMTGSVTVNPAPIATPDVVISEIMYNPPESGTDSLEYIEFYNNSTAAVNLSGYTMDGVTYTFGNVSIAAGAYLTIAVDSMAMYNTYGVSAYEWPSGGLSNGGESVVLRNAAGDAVDSVYYDEALPWDPSADGSGFSLVLCDVTLDNTLATSWTVSATMISGVVINSNQLYGSPNAADAACGSSVGVPGYPLYTIGSVTTSDLTSGVADSLNVQCQITGTIYSIDFDGNAGYSFYIYDATGGINVYSSSDKSGYTSPAIGDLVEVYGSIDQYRGLTEMAVDSIAVVSSANILVSPTTASVLDENTEGEFIRLNGFMLVDPTQWPSAGSSANVDIHNYVDTLTMRIDSDTDIDGSIAPSGTFDVIGAGSQFDASSPYTDGYQIFPSQRADIIEYTGATGYPAYTIGSVTTSDITTGVADSLNVDCALNGVVYSIDFDGNGGYSFYMKDATGGINVYSSSDKNGYTNPQIGDALTVFGGITQYNGLTEIAVDSIYVKSTAGTVTPPMVSLTIDESTEGEHIRLNGMTLVTPSQWPSAGSSANVDITDGTNTFTMRIDSDTDIDGSIAPTGTFDVIGAGSQFDNSSPYTSGYQIFPSSLNDIIQVVPSIPTVTFAKAMDMELESAGTITVNLLINPVATVAETIDLQFVLGSNVNVPADGTVSPAPNLTTGILTLPVAANEDTVSFDISIVDDAVMEGNETLFVSISTLSAGLTMGAITNYYLVIEDNDTPLPNYNIGDVTTVDANGVSDSNGVEMRLHGVVFTDDYDGNAGLSFYMYDNTGGINVFNFNDVSNYVVTRGDSIAVMGEIQMYNGLIELFVDSIRVISQGVNLKSPAVVATLDETTESEYIRMNGMYLATPSQWPTSATGSTNIDITNGTDTFVLRIDSDTDLNGSPAPVGKFDVIGVGGQFDNSSPYFDGYQIMPRDLNDIIINLPKLAVTEIMASAISTISGDWFEVTNYGNVAVDMNGYSWDDDDRISGAHTINGSLVLAPGESVIFLDEVTPDDSTWSYNWMQLGNNLQVIAKDEFGPLGFSSLSSGGDEVNLYDENGALIQRVIYNSTDVVAGFSIQVDTTGNVIGTSVVGSNGVYNTISIPADAGNPGNMNPVSINEFGELNVSLYPNPVKDRLFIETNSSAVKHITITSLTGAVVRVESSSASLVEVDMNSLAKGVYVLSLEIDGTTASRKIVVE